MADVALDTLVALVTACQAIAVTGQPLAGVVVVDGPRTDDSTDRRDRLFVGADLDTAGLAVTGDNAGETLPGVVDAGVFSISCVAETWSGETTDITVRRARAMAIRAAVTPLLRPTAAMITLGVPGLSSAFMGAWQLYQAQTSRGLYAGISFQVECVARPSTS